MLRIGICDDVYDARLVLRAALERAAEKRRITAAFFEFSAGENLLRWLEGHAGELDLVFLDLEMGEVDGENGTIQFGPVGAPRWARWKKRGGEWKTIGLAICEQDMYYEIEDFIAMVRGELDPSPWRQWSGMAAKLLDEARSQAGIDYRPHAPRPEETRDFV